MKRNIFLLVLIEFSNNILVSLLTILSGIYLLNETKGLLMFALSLASGSIVSICMQSIAGWLVDQFSSKKIVFAACSLQVFFVFYIAYLNFVSILSVAYYLMFTLLSISLFKPFIRISHWTIVKNLFNEFELGRINRFLNVGIQLGQLSRLALAAMVATLQIETQHMTKVILIILLTIFLSYFLIKTRIKRNLLIHKSERNSYISMLKQIWKNNPLLFLCSHQCRRAMAS